MLVANGSDHDVDLDTGRVLRPWERAEITPTDRERSLIDGGQLVVIEDDSVPVTVAALDPLPDAGIPDDVAEALTAPETPADPSPAPSTPPAGKSAAQSK